MAAVAVGSAVRRALIARRRAALMYELRNRVGGSRRRGISVGPAAVPSQAMDAIYLSSAITARARARNCCRRCCCSFALRRCRRCRCATAAAPADTDAVRRGPLAASQGFRDVWQLCALNAGYLVTGSLAAPLTASLANQLLFSVLQRRAAARMEAKSAALAAELASMNVRLGEVAARQVAAKAERVRREAAAAAATAAADASASAAAAASAAAQPAATDLERALDAALGPLAGGGIGGGEQGAAALSTLDRLDLLLGPQADGKRG
jgi:hypothetical protein